MMTMICIRKLPGKLYLDKQYARGIPNRHIRIVDIEAVITLKIKAWITLGLVIEATIPPGSINEMILTRG